MYADADEKIEFDAFKNASSSVYELKQGRAKFTILTLTPYWNMQSRVKSNSYIRFWSDTLLL
ncbi:MAG TPA: hypothetical protein VEL11_04690 [Candidatus Bathyarchaeia archaeon]|nr:hypothetical protein [Candidatus Bathyarchaeia archaeon]